MLMEAESIEDGIGAPILNLSLFLLFAWVVIAAVLVKGIRSSGKASYFLALFPYVVIGILLIRAVTLEGAWNGILFFLTPRWDKILEPSVSLMNFVCFFFCCTALNSIDTVGLVCGGRSMFLLIGRWIRQRNHVFVIQQIQSQCASWCNYRHNPRHIHFNVCRIHNFRHSWTSRARAWNRWHWCGCKWWHWSRFHILSRSHCSLWFCTTGLYSSFFSALCQSRAHKSQSSATESNTNWFILRFAREVINWSISVFDKRDVNLISGNQLKQSHNHYKWLTQPGKISTSRYRNMCDTLLNSGTSNTVWWSNNLRLLRYKHSPLDFDCIIINWNLKKKWIS